MNRLLLAGALLSLLTAGAVAFLPAMAKPVPASGAPGSDATIVIDDSGLPGATGWFLDKLTATRATVVALDLFEDVKLYGDGDGAASLVALPGQPLRFGGGAVGGEGLAVSGPHGTLACCDGLGRSLGTEPGGYGGSGSPETIHLQAGDELFVGLAAVRWHPDSVFRATLTGDGLVHEHVGAGDHVMVFDLTMLARHDGTTVHAAQMTLGHPGEGRVSFVAEHGAVVSFAHLFQGDAAGRFRVALPDGQRLDTGVTGGIGRVVGSGGPGQLDLALSELDPGTPWPVGLASRDPAFAWAPGIAADMPLPHRVLDWHHEA